MLEPGLYTDIPAEAYHRDPCPAPSLSASIARVLIEQSPKHAWAHHPRLGNCYEDKPDRQREIGTAAHKLLLGRGSDLVVIEATSYQGGKAKDERADAYKSGAAPILLCDLYCAEAMVKAAREQLLAYTDSIPELQALIEGKGQSETVAIWREGEAWCRSMIDWMHPSAPIRVDYKTTSSSAHPQAVSTRLFGSGVELADSFYGRGLKTLGRPCKRSFYIVQETEAPYALSVVELDYAAQDLGAEKVTRAIEVWRDCMSAGRWPGYEPRVAVAETPAWHINNWNNRVLAHAALDEAEGRSAPMVESFA